MLKLGVHISKNDILNGVKYDTISQAVKQLIMILADRKVIPVAQIFTIGPRNSAAISVDYLKLPKCLYIVHSAYMLVSVWSVKTHNVHTQASKKRLAFFVSHLKTCQRAGASKMVLHLPRDYPDEIYDTMSIIAPIAHRYKIKIALEMTASKPDADRTYETPEKIDNLTTMLKKLPAWCWAIDTAHIWSTGTSLKSYNDAKAFFNSLIYKQYIGLIHLNGSSIIRGGGSDRHEIAMCRADKLFGGVTYAKSGVRMICEFAKQYDIPVILEINRGEIKDVYNLLDRII
jgi:endonuclease IV